MADHHKIDFFGKDQALIIISKPNEEMIHLNFLLKKGDHFQKFKNGIHLQITMEEMCKVALLLEKQSKGQVSIIHKHPNSEDEKNLLIEKQKNSKSLSGFTLWVKCRLKDSARENWFSKPFQDEKYKLFEEVWNHLLKDKIAIFGVNS